jgi:hypothetical protein
MLVIVKDADRKFSTSLSKRLVFFLFAWYNIGIRCEKDVNTWIQIERKKTKESF